MKTHLLGLSAAALLLAATAAQARPDPVIQAFLAQAQSKAEADVAAAGVDLSARTVRVRAEIGSEGRLAGVRVLDSTGSGETDFNLARAVQHVRLTDVPPGLIGANLTLVLGHAGLVQAKAQ
jgi:hypothetical protein